MQNSSSGNARQVRPFGCIWAMSPGMSVPESTLCRRCASLLLPGPASLSAAVLAVAILEMLFDGTLVLWPWPGDQLAR